MEKPKRVYKKKKKDKSRNLTQPPPILDTNRSKFTKSSFLIRRCDLSATLPCIWSIENYVLILKWVEIDGKYQITNRYNAWNSFETHRYIHLELSENEIFDAREAGVIELRDGFIDELLDC